MEEDRDLVDRTLAGDLRAFEALVKRHRDAVYRVAARIVGPSDAEDVSQDAFLRAFHRLSRFRATGPFRAWLLQITHNTALTALAGRRETPLEEPPEGEEGQEGARTPYRTPAERLERRERRERLASKLQMMRPAHRAVLVLRDIEGLSYEEIASVTDTPLGTVKGRLHRARGELIDLLRANVYDWELPE